MIERKPEKWHLEYLTEVASNEGHEEEGEEEKIVPCRICPTLRNTYNTSSLSFLGIDR